MKWNHSTVSLSFVSSKINFNVSTITLNHVTIYAWCDLQTRWLWEPPMRKLKHAKRPHSVWDCCVSCCWSRSQQSVLCVSIHRQKRGKQKVGDRRVSGLETCAFVLLSLLRWHEGSSAVQRVGQSHSRETPAAAQVPKPEWREGPVTIQCQEGTRWGLIAHSFYIS